MESNEKMKKAYIYCKKMYKVMSEYDGLQWILYDFPF